MLRAKGIIGIMNFLSHHKVEVIALPVVFNGKTLEVLFCALRNIKRSTEVVLFQGATENIFCQGMDLPWSINSSVSTIKKYASLFLKILMHIQHQKQITISVINGRVSGGGVGIVAASDIVMSSLRGSFQLSEGLFGLIPGLILPALKNRLSDQKIKRMVFAAELCDAQAALQQGLVDYIIAEDNVEKEAGIHIMKLLKCCPRSVIALKASLTKNKSVYSRKIIRNSVKQLISDFKSVDTRNKINNLAYFMGNEDE